MGDATSGYPSLERFTTALEAVGSVTSDGGRNWTCPAHADSDPSLSVDHRDSRVLFSCHAGCSGARVLEAVRLAPRDLLDATYSAPVPGPVPAWAADPHVFAQYQYLDVDGQLLFTVHRRVTVADDGSTRKDFRQQAADGTWSIRGIDPVLWNLPAVAATAAAGGVVHISEGEKDCVALFNSGAVPTTNPGGAKKWRDALADPLKGCSLVVVWRDRDWLKAGDDPNADTPGDRWARAVVDSLARRGIPYQVVEAAGGKDAWDHLAGGYSLDQAVPVTLSGSGSPDLEGREVVPSENDPMPVARHLQPGWTHGTGHPLRYHWRGAWLVWNGSHWQEEADQSFTSSLYLRLEHAVYEKRGRDVTTLVPWNPAPGNVGKLEAACRAICHLRPEVEEGSLRMPDGTWREPEGTAVSFSNGVLDVASRAFSAPTPARLNVSAVPFDYDPTAPVAAEWLKFLATVWPDDPAAVELLQEWFGYVISGRTDLQKVLFLQGPPRCGKGTIARTLRRLVGAVNYAGPTLASLAENFGLAPLVGKSLAVISDMRMPERNAQLVLERLLSISGEDTLDVDRKYKAVWSGRLPARLTILSNNLPNFRDPSGAFTSRLLLAQMRQSFLGREDTDLDRRIGLEMQGIVNWSLEGLDRLLARGRFLPLDSAQETLTAMADAGSPLGAFLRDTCAQGQGLLVPVDDLYRAYVKWGQEVNGQNWTTTKQRFGLEIKEVASVGGPVQRTVNGRRAVRCYTGVALAGPEPASGSAPAPQGMIPHQMNPFDLPRSG